MSYFHVIIHLEKRSLTAVTCACEGAAFGYRGRSGFIPLRGTFQQVMQAPEAPRQVAQEALFAGAILVGHPYSADVGWGVSCGVATGVA